MEKIIDEEILIRYLTGTTSPEENEQVEQWCAESPNNLTTVEQLYFALQVSNRLNVIRSVDPEKRLSELKTRILLQEKGIRRRILFRRLQRAAAILFIPLVSVLLWLLLHKDELSVQYVELHSNPGMVASFTLPDGSKVWLNGGSRLRFPSVFKGQKREVEMSGKGYFEVAHNALQPFSVKAGETFSLEVLGTSFNLSAYDDEDIIETTLINGSVKLNLLQEGKMVQCMMQPNEKVIYKKYKDIVKIPGDLQKTDSILPAANKATVSVKIATVDPKYDIAWKDNRILFKNHTMEEVIRTLGRYYNVQFKVLNKKVMDSEITGKFTNEQLPQVMEYLKIASGIKYDIIPATVINGELKPETVEIWK